MTLPAKSRRDGQGIDEGRNHANPDLGVSGREGAEEGKDTTMNIVYRNASKNPLGTARILFLPNKKSSQKSLDGQSALAAIIWGEVRENLEHVI